MITAAGLNSEEVTALLTMNGASAQEATRMMLHSMVHGHYASKRYNVICNLESESFTVLVRRNV